MINFFKSIVNLGYFRGTLILSVLTAILSLSGVIVYMATDSYFFPDYGFGVDDWTASVEHRINQYGGRSMPELINLSLIMGTSWLLAGASIFHSLKGIVKLQERPLR